MHIDGVIPAMAWLTAIRAHATIRINRTIHRLRGGVKVPTGGRLVSTSQPANRSGHAPPRPT
jgi:hypothetical protein